MWRPRTAGQPGSPVWKSTPRVRALPITPSDNNKSKEGKIAADFDFLFLRATSHMEKIDGKLQYKCAGCLRHYPSLGPLQRHIVLGWKEGFSCKVFYNKLKEFRSRRESEEVKDSWPVVASGSPDFAEVQRRNNVIFKWLSEIQTSCDSQTEVTKSMAELV